MIENPHSVGRVAPVLEAETDEVVPTNVGHVRVRSAFTLPDYDKVIEDAFSIVDTKIVQFDAKLMEGRGRHRKIVHYRSFRQFAESREFKRRVLESVKMDELKELGERIREVGESKLKEGPGDGFDFGYYPDEIARAGGDAGKLFPTQNYVLPTLGSTMSKQQLFVDYLDMHRKSWEAATRNPIGKKICRIIPQFVLGRSVLVTASDKAYQAEMDDFWRGRDLRNRMPQRIKTIFRELLIYGEIFLRFFRQPKGLVIRSIDPSTIWDIVTNPEDIEDVIYYHQQYVVTNNSPVAAIKATLPSSTLVIRQIPAEDIDHYKINATSTEKRGRSELYTILGYLQRMKEYVNDRMVLNKMFSMFALDVAVEGQQKDVDAAESQFATPPGTGSVIVHNKNVDINFKQATEVAANGTGSDADLFLKIIALGSGVSESFLGVGASSNRASALIQTEPDVKNFEDYQDLVQTIIDDMSDRVYDDAIARRALKKRPKDLVTVATFPSIASEDRSKKLQDLALSESMGWFSKKRAANVAADEFKQTDYDYAQEQEEINQEQSQDPVIAGTFAQSPKGPVETPRLAGTAPGADGSVPNPTGAQALTNPGAQMRSDPASRGLPAKTTNLRQGGLDRGNEQKVIQSNAGLLSSSEGVAGRGGWSSRAREASIAARKAKAARKLLEAQERAKSEGQ